MTEFRHTMLKLPPWFAGQFGVVGSDSPEGLRYAPDALTFYVDPGHLNTSDDNDGTDPNRPKTSIQSAVTAAVTGRGDVIVLAPGRHAPTAAIYLDKAGLTIIAQGYGVNPQQPEASCYVYPTAAWATGPVFIITAPCALIGIEVVARVAAHAGTNLTTGAAIAQDGDAAGEAGGFCLFKNCRFVDWFGTPYGIFSWGASYSRFEGCQFEGFTGAGIAFGARVRNPTYNDVVECTFRNCANGIEHIAGGTAQDFLYKDNNFIDYTDAIDFNNQAADGLVTRNSYETATGVATYDIAVAAAQALGIQFSGNLYSE
jgi:hypothetical protein